MGFGTLSKNKIEVIYRQEGENLVFDFMLHEDYEHEHDIKELTRYFKVKKDPIQKFIEYWLDEQFKSNYKIAIEAETIYFVDVEGSGVWSYDIDDFIYEIFDFDQPVVCKPAIMKL